MPTLSITLRSQESGGIDDQACWRYFAVQHQDCVSVGTVETLSSLESVSVARGLIIALGATATDADDTNDSEATKRSARSKNFKVPNAVASRRGTQSAKVQGKKVPPAQVKTELVPIKIHTKTFSGIFR